MESDHRKRSGTILDNPNRLTYGRREEWLISIGEMFVSKIYFSVIALLKSFKFDCFVEMFCEHVKSTFLKNTSDCAAEMNADSIQCYMLLC